jgi:putative oxidoreductase
MKIVSQIPAYLVGIVFLIFGLNFFLHFIPMKETMPGNAGVFVGLLYSTNYLLVVKVLEVLLALLIFVPVTRALAMILIAPIAVNIMLFELLIAHQPGIGVILVILIAIALFVNREKYMGIIKA